LLRIILLVNMYGLGNILLVATAVKSISGQNLINGVLFSVQLTFNIDFFF